MIPTPSSRPRATRERVLAAIPTDIAAKLKKDQPICVAVRGYYRDTMGKPGVNDVNMYDDAFFWVAPNIFESFNGNTDPTRYGWNSGAGKYMARLKPGFYWFERWKHKGQYDAFGQASNAVTVERVDEKGVVRKTETGHYGINLHKGGTNGTSSEGCLTVPVSQWPAFQKLGYSLIKKGERFPLVLIENKGEF